MQFGNFTAVFGPPGSGMEDQALVAINMGKINQGHGAPGVPPLRLSALPNAQLMLDDSQY